MITKAITRNIMNRNFTLMSIKYLLRESNRDKCMHRENLIACTTLPESGVLTYSTLKNKGKIKGFQTKKQNTDVPENVLGYLKN